MDIPETDLRRALQRGVAALRALQAPDGSFAVTPSTLRPPRHATDSIFSTASVLIAVEALLPKPAASAALDYIAGRRRADGLWAWREFPTDADDSALCLAVLIDSGRLTGSEASRLRQFWREPSGPFRTWPEGFGNEKQPFDAIVNCHVLYGLKTGGAPVGETEELAVELLVERARKSTGRHSEYYHSKSTLFYAATRARLKPKVLDSLLSELRPAELDVQQSAEVLAASPGWNDDLAYRLLTSQREDGGWTGTPWFFDPGGDFCSDAYATAVCVEALARSLDRPSPLGQSE
jgi:hypothetical protein